MGSDGKVLFKLITSVDLFYHQRCRECGGVAILAVIAATSLLRESLPWLHFSYQWQLCELWFASVCVWLVLVLWERMELWGW